MMMNMMPNGRNTLHGNLGFPRTWETPVTIVCKYLQGWEPVDRPQQADMSAHRGSQIIVFFMNKIRRGRGTFVGASLAHRLLVKSAKRYGHLESGREQFGGSGRLALFSSRGKRHAKAAVGGSVRLQGIGLRRACLRDGLREAKPPQSC